MLKVGIIGGTGYVGAELVRYLLMHPEVEIEAISSESFQRKKLSEIYPSYFSLCVHLSLGVFYGIDDLEERTNIAGL